ncbi:hypothetical protein BG004_001826 [Podila humilis]|nr:hypothetical protein BG004_001826 [Podila humilis]
MISRALVFATLSVLLTTSCVVGCRPVTLTIERNEKFSRSSFAVNGGYSGSTSWYEYRKGASCSDDQYYCYSIHKVYPNDMSAGLSVNGGNYAFQSASSVVGRNTFQFWHCLDL